MKQEPIYIRIDESGNKYYYSDRKMTILHRLDGPAIEYATGTKAWCKNGVFHRMFGPAVESANGIKEWWISGKRLTETKYNDAMLSCMYALSSM